MLVDNADINEPMTDTPQKTSLMLADLPRDRINALLELCIVFVLAAEERIPKPCAENETQPTLRLIAFLGHQRNHIHALLVCNSAPALDLAFALMEARPALILQRHVGQVR